MFSQSFDILGYYPAYQPEQLGKKKDEMAVVDGQNFAWRTGGVFSAYANSQVDGPASATLMRHPMLFVVQGTLHAFYGNGIWKLGDDNSWTAVIDYSAAPAFTNPKGYDLSQYKWTTAYVGTTYWFCHPAVGLIYHDVFTGTWGWKREDCWTGPTYAVCLASNRLVVLLDDVVTWSKFDDGQTFDLLNWACGAGAQSLALVEYGQPYSVMSYNGGWVTFTGSGVLVSRPNEDVVGAPDGQSVAVGALRFHHAVLSQEDIPVGPTAVCSIDRASVVWLCQRGFRNFSPSQGGGWGGVAQWQAEMSAFYVEQVLPASRGADLDRFCIDVAKDNGWIFVSSREADDVLGYTRAHVFQPEQAKWGCFDWRHLHVGQSRRATVQPDMGWLDHGGRLHVVDHTLASATNSWVKFSPVRLQMPTDQSLPPGTVTATQDWRIGTSPSGWKPKPGLGLQSSWRALGIYEFSPLPNTKAKFFAYGGWDTYTANGDQQVQLWPVTIGADVQYLVGTTTGVNHTLAVTADDADEFFYITSVEIGYIFAGLK